MTATSELTLTVFLSGSESTWGCDDNPAPRIHGSVLLDRIIDSERKSFRQTAPISENNCMHSGVNQERVEVREERVEEIRTESGVRRFIKVITLDQVRFGFIEDLDLHRTFSRILAFAFSQSSNWAVPSAIRC